MESDELRIDAALFTGFLWPGDLAREMEQRFAARSSVWWASILTYTAMGDTAVLVGARMIILWR